MISESTSFAVLMAVAQGRVYGPALFLFEEFFAKSAPTDFCRLRLSAEMLF